jgi:DNA mismatch repair protein MutS
MMRQYMAAKQGNPDALLFFRMGDFYELFYDDAILAAELLGLTLTTRDKRSGVPMAGVPWHSLDGYVARLVRQGHRVAICDQVEDAKLAKGLVERRVTELVSPGTAIADALVEERANTFLAALLPGVRGLWGIALADASTGEFMAGEFQGEVLAEELAGLPVAEVLVPEGVVPPPALADTEDGMTPLVTLRPSAAFEPSRGGERLASHFGTASLDGFDVTDLTTGIGAAGALLDYLSEMRQSPLRHVTGLKRLRPRSAMTLDEATLYHLDVLPRRGDSSEGTLLGVLDVTRTAMGGRLLRRWLTRPSRELETIGRRIRAVAALTETDGQRRGIRDELKGIGDLERLASRIESGRCGARELRAVADSLSHVPPLAAAVADLRAATANASKLVAGDVADDTSLLADLEAALDPLSELAGRVDRELVPEPPLAITEGGLFRDGVDDELDQIRQGAREAKQWIAELEGTEREKTGIPNLKVGFNRVFGYYIEVSRGQLKSVPEHYIRKQTLVGAERFVTPELKEMESKVLGAEERMARLEHGLFIALREAMAAEVPRLLTTARAIATLDGVAAFAEVARARGYVMPELRSDGPLVISAGRHPVVEALRPSEPFVPNDNRVGEAGAQLLIITGPNMAGKSTYLRQVGLIVLMAHAGSFVPATSATIPLTDRIFTRVGASDRIARGQSTFLVEMEETAVIVRSATARSLVLLDEVGRGTSTYDGLSIAWAVAEYLHDLPGGAPRTLFATHYHELTRLSRELEHVRNLNVAVAEQGNEVRFLRRIVEGAADRSYGIHVAQLAGLPPNLLRRAREVLRLLEEGDSELGEATAQLSLFADSRRQSDEEAGEEPAAAAPASAEESRRAAAAAAALATLREIDPDHLTPIEALQTLATLRQLLPPEPPAAAAASEDDADS